MNSMTPETFEPPALLNTNKQLTLINVMNELNHISNYCAGNHLLNTILSFSKWCYKNNYNFTTPITISKDTIFWTTWLHDKPEVQSWLIEHEFATWGNDHETINEKTILLKNRIMELEKEVHDLYEMCKYWKNNYRTILFRCYPQETNKDKPKGGK